MKTWLWNLLLDVLTFFAFAVLPAAALLVGTYMWASAQ